MRNGHPGFSSSFGLPLQAVYFCSDAGASWRQAALVYFFFLALVMRSRFLAEGISRDGVFKILMLAGSCFFAFAVTEGMLRLFSGRLPVEVQQIISADPSNYGVSHPYIGQSWYAKQCSCS